MGTPGLQHYEPRKWLTITELLRFTACPRKYFYGVGCGLRSMDQKIALTYGEAIHAAFPVTVNEGVRAGHDEFMRVWLQSGLEELGDSKRNSRVALKLLENVHQTHTGVQAQYEILVPPPTFQVGDKISKYEIPFALDIGLPIPLCGRADGLARMKSTGDFWILEYKTTGQLGQQFVSAFEINCQVIGYTIAARETLGLPKIAGGLVEGIFISEKNQQTMTLPKFVRDFHCKEWLEWAHEIGSRILQCEAKGLWPKHFSGCNQIGMFGLPGYNCEFLNLCQVPDWTILREAFKVERHVPFTLVQAPTPQLVALGADLNQEAVVNP